MSQIVSTVLLKGGLNLVTPPIAVPPGQAIAALNYEPTIAGVSRVGGYERFDGHTRPSDLTDAVAIAAARAAIQQVPGTGPVRGVWVYQGVVYAFRDSLTGEGKMFKSSAGGWVEQAFGYLVEFSAGTAEFLEGETLVGGTSGATALIERVIQTSGAWSGSATGYIVVSSVTGTFTTETVTSASGSATGSAQAAITLAAGGVYDFTTHNFYGAATLPRMYFVNGEGFGAEWDGEVLAPIRTGTDAGILEDVVHLVTRTGDRIVTRSGDPIVLRIEFDKPIFISHYKGHLFLGYRSGTLINSSIGLPLEYITTTGAGAQEIGEQITGLLTAAATALVVFCKNRIEYLTGNDTSDFVRSPISDGSGAVSRTPQMLDQPTFLDDGGIRKLSTTAAFGDWQTGTLSGLVEPLIKAKRDAGIQVAASMRVKGKDQYRLFFNDGSGVSLYVGRKDPEILPFKYPMLPFCACSGEVTEGYGDRLFVGAEDGYVYELDRGTSFDGASIGAYLRMPFNSIGSPVQDKRFHKLTVEMTTEDDVEIGILFDVDYGRHLGGPQHQNDADPGYNLPSTADFDDLIWVEVGSVLETHIDGLGKNIAVTLVSESDVAAPHTLTAVTFNASYRGLRR